MYGFCYYLYMATINISLPDKLKKQSDELIKEGYYSSFSDLARTGIRKIIEEDRYELLYKEAKRDLRLGRTKLLKNDKDIESFVKSL